MDQDPAPDMEKKPDALPRPSIPPPDLSRRPPPPPSPLENLPKSAPPPMPSEPVVKVKIRAPGDPGGDAAPAEGLAPFNTRVVAVVIDSLVASGVMIGCVWILPGLLEWIGQLAGLGYFVTRDSLPFLGGQSVGKKAMKLKTTTLEGTSLVGKLEHLAHSKRSSNHSLFRVGGTLHPAHPRKRPGPRPPARRRVGEDQGDRGRETDRSRGRGMTGGDSIPRFPRTCINATGSSNPHFRPDRPNPNLGLPGPRKSC